MCLDDGFVGCCETNWNYFWGISAIRFTKSLHNNAYFELKNLGISVFQTCDFPTHSPLSTFPRTISKSIFSNTQKTHLVEKAALEPTMSHQRVRETNKNVKTSSSHSTKKNLLSTLLNLPSKFQINFGTYRKTSTCRFSLKTIERFQVAAQFII